MPNGVALISENIPGVNNAQWFIDANPGLGSFTNLIHPSIWYYAWPRSVSTNSLLLTNKFVTNISASGRDSSFWTTCTSITPSPGTFSPIHFYYSDVAETYSIAKGSDGRIGILYIINGILFPNENGSVFFMESTDNGSTFGTPTKIFNANISSSGDSLGALRGIQLAYLGNVPKAVFETCKQSSIGYFANDGKNNIRFWSSSLPGSDPNRSIIIADTSRVGYHPLINTGTNHDVYTCICRPTIGVSSDGTGVFIAFIVPSNYVGGSVDTVSFMDVWLTYSANNGSNWVAPIKINSVTPIRDWNYPSISSVNDNTFNYYYVNMTMLSDSIPGSYLYHPDNGESNAKCMFVRVGIPRTSRVNNISSNIPGEYKLYQNYPNPFNPTTKIKFDIPANVKRETSNVKLIMYDILGKEVATLVNEKLNTGSYEIPFNTSQFPDYQLPSGIYFYKLETENFTDVKKLVLIK